MSIVIVTDVDNNELINEEQKEFLRAELLKRRDGNEFVDGCLLEAELQDPAVLESLIDQENFSVTLQEQTGLSRILGNCIVDEYKIKPIASGTLIESMRITGTLNIG